jgi:hypothetical protein
MYKHRSYTSPSFFFNCGDFNITAGDTYSVTFYFADWQATASGQRVFDIKLNQNGNVSTLYSGFDIYAKCGASTACAVTFTITAPSGATKFRFTFSGTGTTYGPQVNGIGVVQL